MPVKVFLQPCSVYIFVRLTSKQQKQKLFLKYTELHWLGYGKTSNSFSRSALHLYYCDISHPQSEVPKRQASERQCVHVSTLAVSGFSATMNMKLRLTRSVPLQMQMMQPSKSASVFPMASNDDKILGSWERQEADRQKGMKTETGREIS